MDVKHFSLVPNPRFVGQKQVVLTRPAIIPGTRTTIDATVARWRGVVSLLGVRPCPGNQCVLVFESFPVGFMGACLPMSVSGLAPRTLPPFAQNLIHNLTSVLQCTHFALVSLTGQVTTVPKPTKVRKAPAGKNDEKTAQEEFMKKWGDCKHLFK